MEEKRGVLEQGTIEEIKTHTNRFDKQDTHCTIASLFRQFSLLRTYLLFAIMCVMTFMLQLLSQ